LRAGGNLATNLRDTLAEAARKYNDKTAIVYGAERFSYSQLDRDSNRIAHALKSLGVGKGDRVAMLLNNRPEFVTVFFGCAKIGAVSVPLDTKYKFSELESLFNHARPKVLVAEKPSLEQLAPSLGKFPFIEHVICPDGAEGVSALSLSRLIAQNSGDPVDDAVDGEDIGLIAYTSGPAFHPRGTMLSHRSLIEESAISTASFAQTENDVSVLFALPMHHVFGLTVIMLTALFTGGTVVIQPSLSMSSLWETVEREKVTLLMGVPYIFALAVGMAEKEGISHDLSSLRLCASSGAPLPQWVRERFKHYYGFNLAEFYGLTEAAGHVTCQAISGGDHPGSVGRVLPGWQAAIVDGQGRRLASGEVGEIIVRGPVMKGYYRSPEDTALVLRDGWLHTGDLGRFGDGGELYIVGLKKDMVIVKGQNVHPVDIETVLCSHPSVAGAAVVGVPDDTRGEKIKAVVSLRDDLRVTEAEIQGFCRERLANYKVPRQIVIGGRLPRDSSGRGAKEQLR
jgi:long-chain acyl-CoA synthetase